MTFLVYSWASGIEFVNGGNGLQRCTILQFNSALCIAASVSDVLIKPSEFVDNQGNAIYPEVRYPGPLPQFKDKLVPLVGSVDISEASGEIDRMALARALNEQIEQLGIDTRTTTTTAAATRPTGALLNARYPAGVIATAGSASAVVRPYERGDATISLPASAGSFARLLASGLVMADAICSARATNANVDAATHTAFAGLTASRQIDIKAYDIAAKDTAKYRQKVFMGVGGAMLAVAFALSRTSKTTTKIWSYK